VKARDRRQGSQGHPPKLSLSQTTGEAAKVTHQISSSRDHRRGSQGHSPKLKLQNCETAKLRNCKSVRRYASAVERRPWFQPPQRSNPVARIFYLFLTKNSPHAHRAARLGLPVHPSGGVVIPERSPAREPGASTKIDPLADHRRGSQGHAPKLNLMRQNGAAREHQGHAPKLVRSRTPGSCAWTDPLADTRIMRQN
jgi:hypothetical protein